MNKKVVFFVSLFLFLSYLGVRTAFAYVLLTSENVSYTALVNVSHSGGLGQISFDVTVALECSVAYNCSTDGVFPPSSNCHLNVTPNSATLSIDYHIERPIGSDLDGSESIPLPVEELSGLLGDSPPIEIPIDSVGTITIIIHGKLLGENITVTPQGSAAPTSLEWLTWAPEDTVVSATVSPVTLKIDTAYEVSFTVTVEILGFDVASKDSTLRQFAGNPSPTFVIPEFPSLLILPSFMIITLLAVIVYRRKHSQNK